MLTIRALDSAGFVDMATTGGAEGFLEEMEVDEPLYMFSWYMHLEKKM